MKNKCETCQFYMHTPNILGGVAECIQDVKPLMAFWPNDACELYKPTNVDKLKAQNDYYREHLGGALKITEDGLREIKV